MILATLSLAQTHISYGQVSIKASKNEIGDVFVGSSENPNYLRLVSYPSDNENRYVLSTRDWSITFNGRLKDIMSLHESMINAVNGQRYDIELGSSSITLSTGGIFGVQNNAFGKPDVMTLRYNRKDYERTTGKNYHDVITLTKEEIHQLFGEKH